MESQQFSLSNYINVQSFNLDELLKQLYNNYNIMSKDYPQYDMVILYNKYETKKKSQLEKECRSVIIDRSNHTTVCYSCPTPIYNIEAVNYIWRNQSAQKNSYICYEGPLISLFSNKNKWYVSTRKCIYDKESEESGQYKMFMDVLRKDGYANLDSFTNLLDSNTSYHFALIHHLNENVVNYKKEFGEDYCKLCFIFARDILTNVEYKSEDIDTVNLSDNIFLPKKIDDYTADVSVQNITELPSHEGIIIKMNNTILKIQTPAYQFHKAIGSEKNMYRGFLYLYQNNILKQFFETNLSIGDKFRKVVNPLNTNETYDMIGMIDCLFKVITSELLFLFNKLYDSNGNQLNHSLYLKLPDEYKNILFLIRGVFFHNKKKSNESIQLKDIYNLLKTIDVNILESFIRTRKLMLNWTRLEKSSEASLFFECLYHCDKIYYKLGSIYTIKLFPEIMQDDIPFKNITIS